MTFTVPGNTPGSGTFDRAGAHREYEAAHRVQLRGGKIVAWEEVPGSMREFEAAWGTR